MNEQVNEQLVLFSMLQLHKSNFQVLHWKATDIDFDTMHKNVTSEYYEMLAEDADVVAENLMRLGINPGNYFTVIRILRETDNMIFVDDAKSYTRDEIVKKTDEIFKVILDQIAKCLQSPQIKDDIRNVGIKSYYENLYDRYDKEYRYLNRRRLFT